MTDNIGHQVVISVDRGGPGQGGSFGEVVTLSGEAQVPNNATLVLIDASTIQAIITLPHPAEYLGWISLVCVDNSRGIVVKSPCQDMKASVAENGEIYNSCTKIFDKSNIEFHASGDSIIFASNRSDTWYCIGKYNAQWYC